MCRAHENVLQIQRNTLLQSSTSMSSMSIRNIIRKVKIIKKKKISPTCIHERVPDAIMEC